MKSSGNKNFRRVLSGLMAFSIISNISSISPTSATSVDPKTSHLFYGEGYEISYEIIDCLSDSQKVQVTLTNTGDKSIQNWALAYDAHGKISDICDGSVIAEKSTWYVVKNAGYNYEVQPETSVSYSYIVNGEDICIPETIELCSKRVESSGKEYNVSLEVNDEWKDGFDGIINIENLSDEPIEAWHLSFEANFLIDNLCNARYTSNDNSYEIIGNETDWLIEAGETVTVEIRGTKTENESPDLNNISLSMVTISAPEESENSSFLTQDSSDEINDNSQMNEELLEKDDHMNDVTSDDSLKESPAVIRDIKNSTELKSNSVTTSDYSEHGLGAIEPTDEEIEELRANSVDMMADTSSTAPLAKKVDLSKNFPEPHNQGKEGACVGFAISYAKSYQENKEHGWGISSDNTMFSPSFIYNQLNGGKDKGINIIRGMNFVSEHGVCSWSDMPYIVGDIFTQPNAYQKERASNFKASECRILETTYDVKAKLASGTPVIIGVSVYEDMDDLNKDNKIYDEYDVNANPRGHHAICLVGYDDSLKAFKFINSWGESYGINGYGYISYKLFEDSNVGGKIGYYFDDLTQHYKYNLGTVKAKEKITTYTNVSLSSAKSTLAKNESVNIISYTAASNGNPPVFYTNKGYITSKIDKVEPASKYTVKYNSNGGSGTMSDTMVTYGIPTKLRENAFKKTGYIFNGWYAFRQSDNKWLYKNSVTGNDKWFKEGTETNNYYKKLYLDNATVSKSTLVNNDVVDFYAQWVPITFTIKFNANGGTGKMSNMTVTYGVGTKLAENKFTKPGCSFKGWYVYRKSDNKWRYRNKTTNKDGWYKKGCQPSDYELILYSNKNSLSGKTSSVNGDICVFYAQWK